MTYLVKVPTDPRRTPTPTGSVTVTGQDSIAPWFGLAMCDPDSYPQNPCTPDSDSNASSPTDPADAGSAFMELQLYPPGFTPFVDSESCSVTKWCAALTIDSLECSYDFAACNANCEEPVNFAFLPNDNTLLINQGDVLPISISADPVRDRHQRLGVPVQHGHRPELHRAAGQRTVLSLLFAERRAVLPARIKQDVVRVELRREPGQHHREFRWGCR